MATKTEERVSLAFRSDAPERRAAERLGVSLEEFLREAGRSLAERVVGEGDVVLAGADAERFVELLEREDWPNRGIERLAEQG